MSCLFLDIFTHIIFNTFICIFPHRLTLCFFAHYRHKGMYPYRDENGEFKASLEAIEPDGHLLLRDENGMLRKYAFKEVQYII